MRVTPALTSAAATSALVAGFLVAAPPASAEESTAERAARPTAKIPTAVGKGGAVSTVANVTAEPEFITAYGPVLTARGHKFVPAGDAFTSASQIGAATAIEFGTGGKLTAVSEPVRRGGGSARVVDPR